MNKKLFVLSGLALSMAPMVAFAQVSFSGTTSQCDVITATNSTFFSLLCRIGTILNAIVPIIILIGVIYFIWGVVTFVIASDEEAKTKGRDRIIYGVIGLAVIVGVWGLVRLFSNTFGLSNTGTFTAPTLPVVIPGGTQGNQQYGGN